MGSILTSVKKMLGISEDYTHFDPEIILIINAVLGGLMQVGIGPTTGFVVTDSTSAWTSFFGDRSDLEMVKTYVYLKVKLMFDPPSSSFVLDAMERQAKEFEWRLNAQVDKYVPEVITVE